MSAFLKSAKEFCWGIVSKTYVWLTSVILALADLYNRFIATESKQIELVGWPYIIIGAAFLAALVTYHQLRISTGKIEFKPDMSPKDLMRYLCKRAKFGREFDDRHSWWRAAQTEIRDELKKGRRLRAEGRAPGQWTDGQFRFPADFIEREFWQTGDLNWILIMNQDYDGPIDAFDRTTETSFVDVKFCRDEVELIWPKRNVLNFWLSPAHFEPFEKPEYRPPPWSEAQDESE